LSQSCQEGNVPCVSNKNTLIARMDELISEEDGLHARKSYIAYDLEGNGAKKVPFECVRDLLASIHESN
jgi:hypothetical protein